MINSLQAHKDEILALWDSGKYESVNLQHKVYRFMD